MHAESRPGTSRVSVVIPAYNAAATLAEALHSVLAQTVPPLEIIVINDGSTDDTAQVLRQFGAKVKSREQKNGGLAAARHAGIAMAQGELIALFDADDICEPDRLALQQAFMEAFPELLLSSSAFSAFNDKGPLNEEFAQSYYAAFKRYPRGLDDIYAIREELRIAAGLSSRTRITTYRGPVYEKLVLGNFIHPPTVMFRRRVLDSVGNYDPAIGPMCDWDWIMQVAKKGDFGYIAHALLRYRVSATQRSAERYRFRRSVGNIDILNRVRERDPEVYRRYKKQFENKHGDFCLDAADALCEQDRIKSFKWLFRSVFQHAYLNRQSVLVLAKIIMPARLRNTLRRIRNHH
ncbi:hypothetical protein BH11PSE11_BH11PSE11_28950 [soil metagenome]